MSAPTSVGLRLLLAVAAGGAVGSLLRWGLEVAVPTPPGDFPATTLLINIAGAFLLGLVHAGRGHLNLAAPLHAFVGPGLLGGFTTFSAYAVQTRRLLAEGDVVVAVAYLVATPLCAVLAVEVAQRALSRGRR